MRLQETQERSKKRGFAGSAAKLIRPNSGQVEQSLRPAVVAERCRKRGEGNHHRVIWRLGCHSLETAPSG